MARPPGQHLGMFMGGVVVEDDVDRLVGRNLALNSVEKADEFDMAVALHAAADDGAVEHAEGGKQGGGAVPLIIVRHGLTTPRLDRQPGLGAIQRLDLAFFIDRQHHGMGRRIDIEPDDVGELVGKAGIARALEGAQPALSTSSLMLSGSMSIRRPMRWCCRSMKKARSKRWIAPNPGCRSSRGVVRP